MKTSESRRQPFIISGEAAEACGPTKGAFDHPTPWEENKATFGFGKLDDFATDSIVLFFRRRC